MPKLVKDKAVVDNDWVRVAAGEEIPASGNVLVNVADWADNAEALAARGAGLWLDSDQAPALIEVDVNSLPVIAINFPAFADGRGYSYAYILRNEKGFTGELRAVGDVLRDQMFYMQRVGFNAFEVREDRDSVTAVDSLSDFDTTYQASTDDSKPLFAKRW